MVDIQTFLETLVQDFWNMSIQIKEILLHACMHTHMHKMDMYLLYYKRARRSGLSMLLCHSSVLL